eukprot:TRINITY_DN3349_c1_g1_i1.p1 TRINITY_DN3349_c1_g1~~TRINITY_DN3349_c1_g1_i1.p1  ORF type:complete len:992 (-),score=101.77 TRINITY_DN3349_c1_g1_i1:614-3589(-)
MSFRVERRFNLLILEEGEDYVADVSATMSLVRRGKSAESKGRLRIGSKSLVFQPDEVSDSILKLPYRCIRSIDAVEVPADALRVECDQFVQIATKTGAKTRIVTPFSIMKAKIVVNFHVHYASVQEYLHVIKTLHEASSKSKANAESVVRGILEEVTASVHFDMSRLGHRERALLPNRHLWVRRVKPLLEVRGMLQISDEAIYFQPYPNFQSKPVKRLAHGDVLHVFRRTYGIQANALEIITVHGSCLYICFEAQSECDVVSAILRENRRCEQDSITGLDGGSKVVSATVASPGDAEDVLNDINRMTALWQSGLLSNYHYIDFLNCAAGRSQNDFSQYPVFPWVIQDYSSKTLNLDDASVYRDLRKPIGALNAKRLDYFKERMDGMSTDERFLYGTHYSTPAYVIYWLLRAMPERMLRLHNGHFDTLPRLFRSVLESWESVNESTASLMELIPEFFVLPASWLENALGITTAEGSLEDVELPAWSSSISDFICKMRAALESDQVSKLLPAWIDLIFGYKQMGDEAVKADNLFHPVCYTGSPGAVASSLPSHVLETQLQEFGRMPGQLFQESHPPRFRIPHWEPSRLLDDPTASEPWYKAVQNISASAADDFLAAAAAAGVGKPTTVDDWSGAVQPPLVKDDFGGTDAQHETLTSTSLQSLGSHSVAPLTASGNITGVACCATNMYAIGEDGCLRVSPLADWNSSSGAVTHGQPAVAPCGSSTRRNFRISPMPLSALAVLRTDLLVIGGHDNAVTLYSSSCGSALAKGQVHADTVTCLGVSPCGSVIASGSRDQSVRTWAPTNSSLKSELTFDDVQQPISCCAASRNLVLAGAEDGQLMVWDRRSGKPVMDRELSAEGVEMCAIDGEGYAAAALDGVGELHIWDLRHRCESTKLAVISRGTSLSTARCFATDFSGWALVGGAAVNGVAAVTLWSLPQQRELRAWPVDVDRGSAEICFVVLPPGSGEDCPASVPFLCATSGGSVQTFTRSRAT